MPLPDAERVDQILAVLLQLAAGDFTARAELSAEGDNIDALAAGINMLAEEIDARVKAVEHSAEELRRQVRERSRQLADALGAIAESEPAPLSLDATVEDRYRVVRQLGAGGMGAVHEVVRLTDGRRLALKTLHGRVDRGTMARFAREAQIATELSHPNLVSVVDLGVTPSGMMYLVMELIDGTTLEGERHRFGEASWAVDILLQVATGLSAIHERNIIHRDLKPANVLLARGVARIADFGIACLRPTALPAVDGSHTLRQESSKSPTLTQRGIIFGTPGYIAPELIAGAREARSPADIYSFGVMAHEMLTKKVPFSEPVFVALVNGRPLPVATAFPAMGLTEEARQLLDQCLVIEPNARPSAAELRSALAACVA